MEKKFFILMAVLATQAFSSLKADPITPVNLEIIVNYDDPIGLPGQHRSPIPEFYLDGYTLTAGSYTVGSTVELLDENDNVVYTAYVYVEGDTIVLPATLSGSYKIRVTRDDDTFVGEIEL